jgi:hypothetical protein
MINDETNDNDYEAVPLKKRFQLHKDDINLTRSSKKDLKIFIEHRPLINPKIERAKKKVLILIDELNKYN